MLKIIKRKTCIMFIIGVTVVLTIWGTQLYLTIKRPNDFKKTKVENTTQIFGIMKNLNKYDTKTGNDSFFPSINDHMQTITREHSKSITANNMVTKLLPKGLKNKDNFCNDFTPSGNTEKIDGPPDKHKTTNSALRKSYRGCLLHLQTTTNITSRLYSSSGGVESTAINDEGQQPLAKEDTGTYGGDYLTIMDAMRELAYRQANMKLGCQMHGNQLTLATEMKRSFLFEKAYQLAYCRNPKAATSTVLNFLLELDDVDVSTILTNAKLHSGAQKYMPTSTKERPLGEFLSFTVVRHPFRRLVSTYCDKMVLKSKPYYKISDEYRGKGFLEVLRYMQANHTYSKPTGGSSDIMGIISDNEIKRVPRGTRPFPKNVIKKELHTASLNKQYIDDIVDERTATEIIPIASFREFAMYVAVQQLSCSGKHECLDGVDGHIKYQVVRCNPCLYPFDMIFKVETLKEDINFLSSFLDLPDLSDRIVRHIDERDKINPGNLNRKGKADYIDEEYVEATVDSIQRKNKPLNGSSINQGGSESVQAKYEDKDPSREENKGILKSTKRFIKINTSDISKCLSYEEYMSQLSLEELDLLYTSYYYDFKLFGYEPLQ